MKNLENLWNFGGTVKWWSFYGNSIEVPQKSKLPYDPTVPLLYIYPKELKAESEKDSCMLIALFMIAKKCKQPKCPLQNE